MSSASSQFPVLLMPVKIETRFVDVENDDEHPHQLWLRIFPDQGFLESFDPILTAEEKLDRASFDNTIDAWKNLVEKYGQYRASWIIHATDEQIETQMSDKDAEGRLIFRYSWLPDYFWAYLYWTDAGGSQMQEVQLNRIDRDRVLSLFGTGSEWMEDFIVAERYGLAKRIKLQGRILQVDRLIVVGMRRGETTPSQHQVKELIENHQYTNGFSFLDYGTPTNNLKGSQSAYASNESLDVLDSFEYAVNGFSSLEVPTPQSSDPDLQEAIDEYPISQTTFAGAFASALGFDPSDFKNIKHANHQPSRLTKLVQKATWFAMGGQMLKMLFGDSISNQVHRELWDFYSEFVVAKGPYPSIKIGDLPYGILPVTHIREISGSSQLGDAQDRINIAITKLFEDWLAMANAPRMVNSSSYVPRMDRAVDNELELVRILSMEPRSTILNFQMMELERLPLWLSDQVGQTPQLLNTYPPYLTYELFQGIEQSDYFRDLRYARDNFLEINRHYHRFFDERDPRFNTFKYAPVFSFKFITELPQANPKKPDEELVPLTFTGEWYKETYLAFLKSQYEGNIDPISWHDGPYSLLLDLLVRGFAAGVNLYYRDVFFTVGISEVEGLSSFTIDEVLKSPGDLAEKGEVVVRIQLPNRPDTIDVVAPFSGAVEELFVTANETVTRYGNSTNKAHWDRRLFRIKDSASYDAMVREMVGIGAQIITELERLKAEEEQRGLAEGKLLVEEQLSALTDIIDLNSFRLDAWITGIAAKRLAELRDQQANGFYFGAYGWVENIRKSPTTITFRENLNLNTNTPTLEDIGEFRSDDLPDTTGGVIHTPTIAQAIVAGMFRQSYSSYEPEEDAEGGFMLGSPYTLNLVSDRIQQAKQFLDGIRQDQDIEMLLGYRLEKFLHDRGLDAIIPGLRVQYPLSFNKVLNNEGEIEGLPNMTVINGLTILERRASEVTLEGQELAILQEGLDLLANIMDGSADMMLYEAAYHMTQGNFSQAAAVMDAAKGQIEPPKLETLDTKLPGTALDHRLIMLMAPPAINITSPDSNPKAFIEPTLEQWLQGWVGPLENIAVQVNLYQKAEEGDDLNLINSHLVTGDQLGLGYLDLLLLSHLSLEGSANELEQRIIIQAQQLHGPLADDVVYGFSFDGLANDLRPLGDVLQVLKSCQHLLAMSQVLKAEDVSSNSAQNQMSDRDRQPGVIEYPHEYIPQLIDKIETCLVQLRDPEASLPTLSQYEVQNAKGALLNPDESALNRSRLEASKLADKISLQLDKLRSEIQQTGRPDENEKHQFLRRRSQLLEICQLLFGEGFLLLPPFMIPTEFQQALDQNQVQLIGRDDQQFPNGLSAGQDRVWHWFEGRAAVDEQTAACSNFLMLANLWASEDTPNEINEYWGTCQWEIAQYTDVADFPWVGLSLEEISHLHPEGLDLEYPDDVQSLAVLRHPEHDLANPWQYGLLIDQFPEFIPDKKVDTGLTFQYNAPNNEAPQAWLLAVSMNDDRDWNDDRLRDIIFDTMDLAKVRMVDTDALKRYGNVLPMTYWFNIPNLK